MKERELLKVVAAGIRRCRKEQGLTIEKLAELSGIDAGFLAHIEVSSKKPSLFILGKIIGGLKVSPEELLWDGPGTDDQLKKRAEALLWRFTRSQQRIVLSIISKLRRTEDLLALKILLRA